MTLYVVATPIGNLGDASERMRQVLEAVAIIACEDTRRTANLLTALGIDTPLISCHEHNEADRVAGLLERLADGDDVALVSDAGTPLLSDPGYVLVSAARAAGIEVVAVPGPSALVAALSVAGLPVDRFAFEGFLPAASGRNARLEQVARDPRTVVLYEAPHRLRRTLGDLLEHCGPDRRAAVCRELTKRFEEVRDGTLATLCAALDSGELSARGELVLVVAGAPDTPAELAEARRLMGILQEELPPAQASRLVARITGLKRREVYALAPAKHPDAPKSGQ